MQRAELAESSPVERALVTGLGLFSLGLGLGELAFPHALSRAIGVKQPKEKLTRSFGAREIGAGIGLLAGTRPAGAMLARVGGDILDLTALAVAWADSKNDRKRLTYATAAVASVFVLDIIGATLLMRPKHTDSDTHIFPAFLINRTVEECEAFLRERREQFPNLSPRFERGLKGTLATAIDTSQREDLRRFKELLECGEIPTTKGQPSGPRSAVGRVVEGMEQ